MNQITDKPGHDPVSDLIMNDAYMRWALEAAEEVVGENGLNVVLREAGLERFIGNFPPNNTEPPGSGITFKDYADFNAGLLNFYRRPGKSIVMRIGRLSAQKGIEHQSGVFSLGAVLAAKIMAPETQIKMGLSAMLNGFVQLSKKHNQEFKGSITDGGSYWIYTVETDPLTAGKQSDHQIGWLVEAMIEESSRQIFGKFFDVEQVACRSMGAPASVWHVPKQPSLE